jgi:hypothetical protein
MGDCRLPGILHIMAAERDPVSVLFDRGARALLARAYATPGQWAGTSVAPPSPRHIAHFAGRGINVLGQDQWGRDRWAAGFVRALYYQHKWFYVQGQLGHVRRMTPNDSRGLQYELGRMTLRGRAVRIRVRPGGAAAMRAVKRLPDARRIYRDDGSPAARWADPAGRDW